MSEAISQSTLALSNAVHKDYGFSSGALFDQFLSYLHSLGDSLSSVILSTGPQGIVQNTEAKDGGESGEPYHEWVIEFNEHSWTHVLSNHKSGKSSVRPYCKLNRLFVRQLLASPRWPAIFKYVNIITSYNAKSGLGKDKISNRFEVQAPVQHDKRRREEDQHEDTEPESEVEGESHFNKYVKVTFEDEDTKAEIDLDQHIQEHPECYQ